MSAIAVATIQHDDDFYVADVLQTIRGNTDPSHCPSIAFISSLSWHGQAGEWQAAASLAKSLGMTVVTGEWSTELAQRQAAIEHLLSLGFTHAIIPDGDEIIEPRLLDALLKIAQNELADRVYVHWDTYWKSPEYVIRPREPFTPCYLIDLRVAKPTGGRNFEGGRALLLGPEYGIVHHLSWVGPEQRIQRKLETWGHAKEVLPGWHARIWQGWDRNRRLHHLHPTHPQAYGFAEKVKVPEILLPAWERFQELAGPEEAHLLPRPPLAPSPNLPWPKVSVIIPAFGGADDLAVCLSSLSACQDLVHEVLVVDDGTPGGGDREEGIGERREQREGESGATTIAPAATSPKGRRQGKGGKALARGVAHDTLARDAAPKSAPGPPAAPSGEAGEGATPAPTSPASESEAARLAAVVARFPFATLHRQGTNQGFAATCNAGAAIATGEMLLFLNSDTAVPREGLIRLVESLQLASPLVAAAGPYTNRSGHLQPIEVTYTSLDTLDLFAGDFAHQSQDDAPDRDVDMLVGFCLLIRASAFNSLPLGPAGSHPTGSPTPRPGSDLSSSLSPVPFSLSPTSGFDTRFGIGTFEDNDLCYRLRREGFRLLLAGRAFVHHEGSKTLTKAVTSAQDLLARNLGIYKAKWKEDIASGFASHLAGLPASAEDRIRFDPARQPEQRLQQARQRAREAGISLVMIVKNEERVLGDCLASAMPYFAEAIVVDTGSSDRTVEIAQAAGAKVFHFPWTNSFSEARNESLRHASGRWLFWLDADDTLTIEAGEAILDAALAAPPEVMAFVVPVQFVEEGGILDSGAVAGGTRVDHVKLLRNAKNPDGTTKLSFEGRIHEQVLPALRRAFGPDALVARAAPEAIVLHSGYDTSSEGQARKRERDEKLLQLDLAERPGHPFVLFNLGMTEHYGGRHEEAIEWLEQCLDASTSEESHVRKAYSLMAVSQRELGDGEKAIETLLAGIAAVGDDPELHFQAGYTLSNAQRWQEAREHYEKAVAGDATSHFSSVDVGILGYKAFHNLGQVCYQLGDFAAARSWWERAIEAAPAFTPSLFCLFDAAIEQGDQGAARWCLERLHALEGASESWAGMLVKLAESVGGPGNGDAALSSALHQHGDSLGVKLVLARRLLNSGREGEAVGLLHELSASGISEAAFFLGVMANRRGSFSESLGWMERAQALNPGHAETRSQVENLRRLLSGERNGDSPGGALSSGPPARRGRGGKGEKR